jgi:tRNA A-37 threonylcarbamoyl transferase component Bud32
MSGRTSDYVEIRSPVATWKARWECSGAVERGEADVLFERSPDRPQLTLAGRGPIVRFSLAGLAAIGKLARHGGVLAPILGDLYLGRRRIFDQAMTAQRLEAGGVATPRILAVGTARVLGPIHRQAIVSRELHGAQNLLDLATVGMTHSRRSDLLIQCADLLRRMHDAGFLHADLNVGNIVLERDRQREVLHIVDLDRGRFVRVVSRRQRLANLERLLRSYEKWIAARLHLTPREEIRFLRRYAQGDRSLLRFLARSLARHRTRLGPRRLCWRLAGAGSNERLARPFQ